MNCLRSWTHRDLRGLHVDRSNCSSAGPKRSYELFAEYVIPQCRNLNVGRRDSISWVGENHELFFGAMQQATREAIEKYKAGDGGRP